MAEHISRTTKVKSIQVSEINREFHKKYAKMKAEYDEKLGTASVELEKHRKVDSILTAKFRLDGGREHQMGTEMSPTYAEVAYVLNKLGSTIYVQEYKLLPENVPVEILSAPTKEVVHSLIPLLVSSIERKVIAGAIDVFSPNNRALVLMTAVMAWYWHRELQGPKPLLEGLVKVARPKIYQDAALVCPICEHQAVPPKNLVLQSAKAWWYLKWLEKHFQEYHVWAKPGSKTKKESAKE
jgi:hypothetical protein